ncbi:bi-domain-containing oxidoreductase [Ulvibacterium sp.]|uniref:bi-domain-containing oxidoreductase n=1 Tax=Ulvibacterium sp. TaxID=2665914 RepID=UPI00261F1927|nr:bi-domain-containing oxidoreductase [Ulvibacterium sp.]
MKQIIQSFKTGETILEDVPKPQVKPGHVLIRTTKTLVSLGTEKMLVEFGKANLLQKAKQQPDKVKEVLNKVKSDGLMPTVNAVFNKLSEPLALGYCNVGIVEEIGKGVSEFKIGDRVASNGAHAEFVCIPKNLVVPIPKNVTDEEACFTVIGSIGLQGIRLLKPTFGETVVVIGLGLIGLITAQLLKANGCEVIGYDLDKDKVNLASSFGITAFNPGEGSEPVKFVMDKTNGIGCDGVVITASTKSDVVISDAAKMSRKKGKIVLVGVIGLNLSRSDFYEKELDFQVSCSYGPGRYDSSYENKGQDYPIAYVRWTEKRNFEAILKAISNKSVDVKSLITQRVPIKDFSEIYDNMKSKEAIASILEYSSSPDSATTVVVSEQRDFGNSKGVIGIVGAGNFTRMTLLPMLKKANAEIKYIVSSKGLSGTGLAKKYGISRSTTSYSDVLEDSELDVVIITTQHNLHSEMVIDGLKANKHVFVEKPLAINHGQLDLIEKAYNKSQGSLMVGFNRRFSPHISKMKSLLGSSETPINVIATMNAGFIPENVWVHDMEIGGGRIIGEACHYIDLLGYLTGSKVTSVCLNSMGKHPKENTDNASILLRFENGSNAVINYFANGSKSYSKERLEVYSQERTLIMDNFISTKGYGFKGFGKLKTKMNKGHFSQFENYINSVSEGNGSLIDFESIMNTSRASIAAIESLKTKSWISV